MRLRFPKGLDLAPVSQACRNAITRQLNDGLRKCINLETPAQVFARKIMNLQHGVALRI
jgi:transposase, IS30 family